MKLFRLLGLGVCPYRKKCNYYAKTCDDINDLFYCGVYREWDTRLDAHKEVRNNG